MKSLVLSALFASAFVFSPAAKATPITWSSTLEFQEIQAREYLVGTEGTFHVPEFESISLIRLFFTSLDADFNGGVGPNGGDTGVEIAILSALHDPERFGITSVVAGNQLTELYPGSGDPLSRFEVVLHHLLTGSLTVSLGSWENFPGCCSQGFPLDESSFLTLEIVGERASVPVPAALVLLLLGLPFVWRQARR